MVFTGVTGLVVDNITLHNSHNHFYLRPGLLRGPNQPVHRSRRTSAQTLTAFTLRAGPTKS